MANFYDSTQGRYVVKNNSTSLATNFPQLVSATSVNNGDSIKVFSDSSIDDPDTYPNVIYYANNQDITYTSGERYMTINVTRVEVSRSRVFTITGATGLTTNNRSLTLTFVLGGTGISGQQTNQFKISPPKDADPAGTLTITNASIHMQRGAAEMFVDKVYPLNEFITNQGIINLNNAALYLEGTESGSIKLDNNDSVRLNLTNKSVLEAAKSVVVDRGAVSISSFALTVDVAADAARTVSIVVKDTLNDSNPANDVVVYSNDAFSVAQDATSITIPNSVLNPGRNYTVSVTDGGDTAVHENCLTPNNSTSTFTVHNDEGTAFVSNSKTITVDAWSKFSADSFTNNSGSNFNIVYNPDNVNGLNIGSFTNSGTITIDISKYLATRKTNPVVTIKGITFPSGSAGTVKLVDAYGAIVSDVVCQVENKEIVLLPAVVAKPTIYVNAKWTGDEAYTAAYSINVTTRTQYTSSYSDSSTVYERYAVADETKGEINYYAWRHSNTIVYTLNNDYSAGTRTGSDLFTVYKKSGSNFVSIASGNVSVIEEKITEQTNDLSLVKGGNAFSSVQEAIEHAEEGATIVFYSIGDGSDSNDFLFYKQGLVTVDKDLTFQSVQKGKAVKFDSLKIIDCEATFKTGIFSLEDVLDNDGTMNIIDGARFNADLIRNSGKAVLLVSTDSRLVAASIDTGTVEVRTDFTNAPSGYEGKVTDIEWLELPLAAKIGDNVPLKLVYSYNASYSPLEQDGVKYEYRLINGAWQKVVVETVTPGDRIFVEKIGNNQYFCRGSEEHATVPTGDSFHFSTEHGGVQFVRDTFDLTDADLDNTYNTAAIYVNNTWGKHVLTLTGLTAGKAYKYSVNSPAISGTVTADADGNAYIYSDSAFTDGTSYTVNLRDAATDAAVDPQSVAAAANTNAASGLTDFTAKSQDITSKLTFGFINALNTEARDVKVVISDSESGDILEEHFVSLAESANGAYSGLVLQCGKLSASKTDSYTVKVIDGETELTLTADDFSLADIADHEVTVSATNDGDRIVYGSFLDAMSSTYLLSGHTIGSTDEGMIIRLQDSSADQTGTTYIEGIFKDSLPYDGPTSNTSNSPIPDIKDKKAKYHLIIEPDRYWDETDQQWHYDNVSMILGGTFGQPSTPNLITFYKLKSMEVDQWVVGQESNTGKTSVVNFVDIEDLRVTAKLKPQGGATMRILNCNVLSDQHFSVTGGTLIIENSNVNLDGATKYGALSTENNYVGSGTVIIRNSVFKLTGTTTGTTPVVVNLKINSEFAISGTCTIDGVFTNLDEKNGGSDTYISFRDAILDENTSIRGKEGGGDYGASLRFEGYNILDGTFVQQNGNNAMTVEAGATVDMSGGASISVGGEVEVSNCGNINLDNSSITAGSFTNQGNLTLTNGSTVGLTGTFTNDTNGTLTAGLHSDGTLGITGTGIQNEGTIYIDLSHTDLPDNLYIDLENLSGSGDVVVLGGGGVHEKPNGEHEKHRINLFTPPKTILYVSREWDDEGIYKKGSNVGSYTYFGYNAYDDNPGDSARDLAFATDTSKVVYYGGNEGDAFSSLNLSAAADVPNQFTITTVGSMATTKMAVDLSSDPIVITRSLTDDIYLSVEVRDSSSKVVETKSLFVGKKTTGVDANSDTVTFNDIVFYSANLTAGASYTVKIEGGGISPRNMTSNSFVTAVSPDRDTVHMGALTVGSQTVTLSGATMSLHDTTSPASASIVNSGTLKIGTGENAVLEIPVAPSTAMRNVKVKIQIGSSEEYHTVQASKDAPSIIVESRALAPGQEYTVSVTDIQQLSAKAGTSGNNVLKVDVVEGDGNHATIRHINVMAMNAKGAKYTFTNIEVAGDETVVFLDPRPYLDTTSGISGTVTGEHASNYSVRVDEHGDFILHANSAVTGDQKISAYVQKTVGDTVCRFDYTFDVKNGESGDIEDRVSTRLTTEGYYYVESEEPAVSVTATVTDSISGSVLTAETVTNSGTISVTSQKDFGSLALTGLQSAEARSVQVTVKDGVFTVGTYDVQVEGNATTATLVSSDLIKDKNYTATVTDTYYTTGSVSGTEAAPQLKFGLGGNYGNTVSVRVALSETGESMGTYIATRISSGVDEGKYTIVSGEFAASTRYTISYYDAQEALVARTEFQTAETPVTADASKLAFSVGAGAARTVTAVVKDGSSVVGTFDVDVSASSSAETCYVVSSNFTKTAAGAYTVSIAGDNTYAPLAETITAASKDPRKAAKLVLDVDQNNSASRWIEVKTKPTLSLMTGLPPGKYDYSISTGTGTVSGSCIVDSEGKTSIKSDGLTAKTEYTVTLSRNNATVATVDATAVDTYSLFVEKGSSKAELTSEDFMVGTDYSDITIKDAYSVAKTAADGRLMLTGLVSSDKVIRPGGELQRPLTVTVMDGAVKVGTYSVANSDIIDGTAFIESSDFKDKEYILLVEDTRTVVATAETLTTFDAGAVSNDTNKTITVTDATFKATSVTNDGTISLTNALFTVGTTDEYEVFHGGTITNNSDKTITLDMNSLITAGSIANSGTITIDARLFDTSTTDMKKVIDLDTSTPVSGLVLDVTGAPNAGDIGILYDSVNYDYWVIAADQSTVYVNSAWATDPETGLAHKTGDNIGDKLYYGYNAFSSLSEAYAETLKVNPYSIKKGDSPAQSQQIATIKVCDTSLPASPVVTAPQVFQDQPTQGTLAITKSGESAAITVIPFENAENGILTLIPADTAGMNIAISDVTIQTTGTGSLHLGGDESTATTGTVTVNSGTIDSGDDIVVYGQTNLTGSDLKAASARIRIYTTPAADPVDPPVYHYQLATEALPAGATAVCTLGVTADLAANETIRVYTMDRGKGLEYHYQLATEALPTGGTAVCTLAVTDAINVGSITIQNDANITMDLNSMITAATLNNANGTITVDATGYNGSFMKLIDVDSDAGLDLTKISLTNVPQTYETTAHLLQLADGDVYLGTEDQRVLYVNSDYTETSCGSHLYGYNAFSSLDEITYGVRAQNQTARYPDTIEINMTGNDSYGSGGNHLYYTDRNVSLTGSGAVNIGYGRFYLMHAVTYEKADPGDTWYTVYTMVNDEKTAVTVGNAATVLPLYTIASGLTLNMTNSGPLKIGDVLDQEDIGGNRTAGAARLQIDGTVTGNGSQLYLAPYSQVAISTTGRFSNTDPVSTSGTILRPNAILTVTGDRAALDDANENQVVMDNVSFLDGGTVSLAGTRAQISQIRMEGLSDPAKTLGLIKPTDAVITINGSYVETTTNYTGYKSTTSFFTDGYAGSYVGRFEMKFNLTNSTMVVHTDFNPNSETTVTVSNSTLTANSITNAGTINLGTQASVDPAADATTAALTVTGAIVNTGTISINNIDLFGEATAVITAADIDNTKLVFDLPGTEETVGIGVVTAEGGAAVGSFTATRIGDGDTSGYSKYAVISGKFTVGTEYTVTETSTETQVTPVTAVKSGTITIDATTYVPGNGMKKLISLTTDDGGALKDSIDFTTSGYYLAYKRTNTGCEYWVTDVDQTTLYVDGTCTGSGYGTYAATHRYDGYNTFSSVADAVTAANSTAVANRKIVLDGLTVDTAPAYFGGVTGEVTDVEFVKSNLFAGKKIQSSGTFSFSSDLTVSGSSCLFVSGGSLADVSGGAVTINGDTNLVIRSGTFENYVVAGADKVKNGSLTRNGHVTLKIEGGSFKKNVGAGIISSGGGVGSVLMATNIALPVIDTEVTGGSFAAGTWLYGGSFSDTRTGSDRNTIIGNVRITVDSSGITDPEEAITLGNISVGSHGFGQINGNTELIFKGSAEYLTITGQIMGGGSGAYSYYLDEEDLDSLTWEYYVTGSRTLSFTGFNGALNCTKITGFSDVAFKGNSTVELNNAAYDLSGIDNWTFENGSCLADSDFANDFTGDTMILKGFAGLTGEQVLITELDRTDSQDIFSGFDSLGVFDGETWTKAAIQMMDDSGIVDVGASFQNDAWSWSADGYDYTLALRDGEENTREMVLGCQVHPVQG